MCPQRLSSGVIIALSLVAWLAACGSKSHWSPDEGGTSGSKSHWMEVCPDGALCEEGQGTCIGGICTSECTGNAACQLESSPFEAVCAKASASAFAEGFSPDPFEASGLCLVACTVQSDCNPQSRDPNIREHECADGFCIPVDSDPCVEESIWSPPQGSVTLTDGRSSLPEPAPEPILEWNEAGEPGRLNFSICGRSEGLNSYHARFTSTGAHPGLSLSDNGVGFVLEQDTCTFTVPFFGTDVWNPGEPMDFKARIVSPAECNDRWPGEGCDTVPEDPPCGVCWELEVTDIDRSCRRQITPP